MILTLSNHTSATSMEDVCCLEGAQMKLQDRQLCHKAAKEVKRLTGLDACAHQFFRCCSDWNRTQLYSNSSGSKLRVASVCVTCGCLCVFVIVCSCMCDGWGECDTVCVTWCGCLCVYVIVCSCMCDDGGSVCDNVCVRHGVVVCLCVCDSV